MCVGGGVTSELPVEALVCEAACAQQVSFVPKAKFYCGTMKGVLLEFLQICGLMRVSCGAKQAPCGGTAVFRILACRYMATRMLCMCMHRPYYHH